MDSQQKPARRMTDMGPRRSMDMMRPARPTQPVIQPTAPQPVPQPRPMPRPAAPQPVARPAAAPRPVPTPAQPQAPQAAPAPAAPKAKAPRANKGGGGWRVAVQFIIGLLVIVGVAAAVIALYLKYYT